MHLRKKSKVLFTFYNTTSFPVEHKSILKLLYRYQTQKSQCITCREAL